MNTNLYVDAPVKTFIRQEADYIAQGLDGTVSLVMPVDVEDDRVSIEAKGINWPGLMRQLNQVYKENVGNLFAAAIRKALSKNEPLPGQKELDAIVAKYDFSGVRVSSGDSGMSEAEKVFHSILRSRLKDLLRAGIFSADRETKLTVQTQVELAENELKDGKVSVEDFETIVEAATEGAVFDYEDRSYNFGGTPKFEYDDEGNIASYENLAAVPAHCQQLAEVKLAAEQAIRAVKAIIPG